MLRNDESSSQNSTVAVSVLAAEMEDHCYDEI